MKIYVAGKFGMREKFRSTRDRLRALGHEVTSRWLDDNEGGSSASAGSAEKSEAAATEDVEDVRAADAVMFFSMPVGSLNTGGGRYFELGLAFSEGKRLIVVGEKETIFHHLPEMEVYDSEDEALGALGEAY